MATLKLEENGEHSIVEVSGDFNEIMEMFMKATVRFNREMLKAMIVEIPAAEGEVLSKKMREKMVQHFTKSYLDGIGIALLESVMTFEDEDKDTETDGIRMIVPGDNPEALREAQKLAEGVRAQLREREGKAGR